MVAADKKATDETELVHFRWKRFKQLLNSYIALTDKQLAEHPTELEASIGSVMDALDFILYHRSRLHHGLSRKAKRHGIDPAKFGWGFHKRIGLEEIDADVQQVLDSKEE